MGSVDHDTLPDKDADVGDAAGTVAVLTPEQHITRLRLGAGKVLAHLGVVLSISSAGYLALVDTMISCGLACM